MYGWNKNIKNYIKIQPQIRISAQSITISIECSGLYNDFDIIKPFIKRRGSIKNRDSEKENALLNEVGWLKTNWKMPA